MSQLRRAGGDPTEIEALITDRYLDSLLALAPAPHGAPLGDPELSLRAAVRDISRRLATDLPRFHPSFRFEERLAVRLGELAASIGMPLAAGGEAQTARLSQIPLPPVAGPWPRSAALGLARDDDPDRDNRPLLIGGAVAASALSLAGAWLAWRRRTSPMARAVRAAHSLRLPVGHG